MKILIVGAGGTGGYFGGRLAEAGADVTFLVRPARAAVLAETGLMIRSRHGDATLPCRTVTAAKPGTGYDLVLLGVKSYALGQAIADVAPAIGPGTLILPMVNGMGHLAALDRAFGAEKVLGGVCLISSTLGPRGEILHLNDVHKLILGPRDPGQADACARIGAIFARANFDHALSRDVLQDMWEKWIGLATLAAITCLMRGSIGQICRAGGADLIVALHAECGAIAEGQGHPARPSFIAANRAFLTDPGSDMTASMFRDLAAGGPTEAEHVVGDLAALRPEGLATPILDAALCHLRVYERARALAGNPVLA
ncbi:MAG: oxidoreductase [Rhodovulum sulfidophilum]|uniref:2-dehydropantoate 2-reductase n=1 Tax=Rhodovulum sulfidophilum TaxID=35806 RepID=A0A2W5PYP1_RHOSU|nr:MAG: oxidoreductase [Rhodovulum sulfidophilum]